MEIIESGSQPPNVSTPACGTSAGCDGKFIKSLAEMFEEYARRCNGAFWEELSTIHCDEPSSEPFGSSQEA